ncbi:enoyl-CoA hydratase/isomerase family protein [Marivibrio halodurans]|uniref:enoyl-CoA hydratase/isomerase family protein n=1 Tax=Marivibrio halodurans TaxID=2039722 RepID=UPI0031BB5311
MTETESRKFTVLRDGPVARVRLTNPDKHNAFDDGLIRGLTDAFAALGAEGDIRVVVLESEGRSFSAGADLNWMKRMAGYDAAENKADAMALAGLLDVMNSLPKPLIGLVQGAAFGGGVGLVSCCDIAIGTDRASFALSEVKLGLIPAAISPYVVKAMGQRAARRYFLTGERFSAGEAHRLGLLHEVVADEAALVEAGQVAIDAALTAGPMASAEAKDLIFAVDRPLSASVIEDTAERIARVRASDEGKEGVNAFLEKRKPAWLN